MPTLSLLGILQTRAPIQDLERLWLEASCYYAVFDENILEDTEWDHLGKELWERRAELSPYFCHACKLGYPAKEREAGENPLVTATGIDWEMGLGSIVVEGIRKESHKRVSFWRLRLERLRGMARKEALGETMRAHWSLGAEKRKAQQRKLA